MLCLRLHTRKQIRYSQLKHPLVLFCFQAVSTGDVRREITFCKKTGLRILGIVENMSGFVCPHCSVCKHSSSVAVVAVKLL